MGYGRTPSSSYSNCGSVRPDGMGAGIQHGGNRLVPADVGSSGMLVQNPPAVNNNLAPGYGYTNGDDNLAFAGSGRPLTTAYNANQCGGKRKRTSKRKHKRKHKHTKRHRKKAHKRTHHHKRRKKGTRSKTHKGKNYTTRRSSKRYSQKRLKKLTGRRTMRAPIFSFAGGKRVQKGGYAQYGSNVPDTPGYSQPNPGPMPWATGPGSYAEQTNCVDNYNHFTGKGGPSPTLDKGVSQ